jgi:hypothetical protein
MLPKENKDFHIFLLHGIRENTLTGEKYFFCVILQ